MARSQNILVGILKDTVLIRVEGYGDREIAYSFHSLLDGMIKEGHRQLLIDLSACDGVDSTFMGVLVASAMSISANSADNSNWMRLVCANPHTTKQLEMVGVHEVLDLCKNCPEIPVVEMKNFDIKEPELLKKMEFMRDYHKVLVEMNQKNAETFGGFVTKLTEELDAFKQH